MDLISLVITLIVVGVLLWLVNNYISMDRQIRRILVPVQRAGQPTANFIPGEALTAA
jgi:hypothetical protein